jgi:TPR repeat protein
MHSNFKVYSAAVLLLAVGMLSSAFASVRGINAIQEEFIPELQERALQGDVDAQSSLGFMYRNGEFGVVQDYAEAARWYRLAADQGLSDAQYDLGLMYGDGEGVEQDDVRAHMWANIAASLGNDDGRELRERMASRMTPQQIEEAQERATRCVESNYSDCD